MRLRPQILLAAMLLPVTLLLGPAAVAAAPNDATLAPLPQADEPVYLALGDSVAAGVGAPENRGYVDLLLEDLRSGLDCGSPPYVPEGCDDLALADLSVPGATTATLLTGQLPAALTLLAGRNGDEDQHNDVRVVTITIGGNDVFQPVVDACIPAPGPECARTIQRTLTGYATNLTQILAQLRAAAGPDTTIVTTAYYNPLAACFLADFAPLADTVLEGGPLLPSGLNDITREVSAGFDARVADAYGQLELTDYVGGQDCLHPDASGHLRLAEIFADVIL
jgi:lysophospholipase L1-like esterase